MLPVVHQRHTVNTQLLLGPSDLHIDVDGFVVLPQNISTAKGQPSVLHRSSHTI